ncbi:MAG: DUF115 domain-containing protein [Magnetococcales bacterium]|nr:DUF115 domain-containing protein [Magnetococcales bacterium]
MDSNQSLLGPVLVNKFGERYYPSIIGETFSLVGSDSFYQRHFGQSLQKESHLYLIAGTDGGLLLQWLMNRGVDADSRYLFIEHPDILEQLYQEGIIGKTLPDQFFVEPYERWYEKANELSLRDYFYVSKLSQVQSLSVVDGYHDVYVGLGNKFSEDLGQFKIQMSQEVGSRIFNTKGLENLAENRIPVSVLDDGFAGKTAILMAGGPSLDESFEWIRQNRANLVVLAVTRIAGQLKREEIVPDFMFAIDPNDIIFHQSKEMLGFYQQTCLINMYHLNPQLVGQWRGISFYMGPRFPWDSQKNPLYRIYPGITVSHQALGAAIQMGFSRIILTGFDLCFSKEGFTHAKGSEESLAGPYARRSQLWVQTNGGWMAETAADFFNAIPALSSLAGLANDREGKPCQVVNPSKASAKIEQVTHIPWDQLRIETPEISAWELVTNRLGQADIPSPSDHYRLVEEELVEIRGQLLKIKKLAQEALVCNERLFGRKGRLPDFKYKKRMDEIEIILDGELKEISSLVKRWSVGDLLKLSRPDKSKEWSDAEIEETGRRYYEIYRDSSKDFLTKVDETRQRIRARLEEEKPRPQMKILLDQWQKDKQPGRLQRFLDQTKQTVADFPEKQAKPMSRILQSYQEILSATETDYRAHCQNILAPPMAVLDKANHFYSNNEIDRLENFLAGIKKSNLKEREAFVLLLEGYLAQKAQQFDLALERFNQVESELLSGECLKRILSVHLSRSDLDSALPVARKLSEKSLVLLPYYADLLRLTGSGDEAVKVYKQYLGVVNEDLVTKQKLGKLYGDLGNLVAAKETFEAILQKDPHNKAAHLYLEQYSS